VDVIGGCDGTVIQLQGLVMVRDESYSTVISEHGSAREKFNIAMNVAKCLLDNGEQVELSVKPALDSIGARQRGFLHAAVLPQIAEQAFVGEKRERFVVDIWREYFYKRFIPPRYVMRKMPGAKKATPHRERVSSEQLGVKRYSEWIDRIIDTAVTELDVVFEFRPSEREGVRYVSKPKKNQQQ
jgi:hypothetical protein